MDTFHDLAYQFENEVIGRSANDFRNYLLNEKYVTELELACNPSIVCKLMNDDNIWEGYKEETRDRYITYLEDQRMKHGGW